MHTGWNHGDFDEFLDRLLQQSGQEDGHAPHLESGGVLMRNVTPSASAAGVAPQVRMTQLAGTLRCPGRGVL